MRNTKILHAQGAMIFTPAALYLFTSLCTQIAELITTMPAIIEGRNKEIKPENKFIICIIQSVRYRKG
jgi:predicted PurR-regulated permease PerM